MNLKSRLVFCIFASQVIASRGHARCRCRPSDSCWPSQAQWNDLNATISGNLHAIRPVGSPCHDPTFDAEACSLAASVSNDSIWRATELGALQWTNWEERLSTNESCFIDTSRSIPCGQGRISLFSAAVKNAGHIQAAVRFARKHDLRLAIKNSGHCFLGRSSAPESLQIATHALDSIQFIDNFIPQGRRHSEGPAVTIGAGVLAKPLYNAVANHNVTVVAGLSHTVGAAGGYIQGGGHSALGTWKGMAADNALEFTVVNAEGDIIVANNHKNTDLFWALRGGGGGTFGVVASVTLRTFPEVPVASASLLLFTANTTGYWEAVQVLHANLPAINDAGGSGYYYIFPAASEGGVSTITGFVMFANKSDVEYVDQTFGPTVSGFSQAVGNASFYYSTAVVPESKAVFADILNGSADTTGVTVRVGSRLISHDLLSSPEGPAKVTGALRDIVSRSPGIGYTGHLVAGGKVAQNSSDTAINPAWRRTVTHITFGAAWANNAPAEEKKAAASRITNELLPVLRALEPDMGAYLNEADADEVNWQTSFWGPNYERLYKLKKKWDPRGLFITRRGVGSEEWDEDGLCRV